MAKSWTAEDYDVYSVILAMVLFTVMYRCTVMVLVLSLYQAKPINGTMISPVTSDISQNITCH